MALCGCISFTCVPRWWCASCVWLRLATLEQLLDSAITTCPATLLGSPAAKDALGMVLMLATAAIPMTNRAPVRSVSMFATHLCLWGEAATANGRAGARRRLRRGTSGVVDLTPFKAVIDAALAVQGAAVVSACVASLVAPRDAHTTAAANARTAQTAVTATRGAIVRVLHAVMAYTMDQVGRCPMCCAHHGTPHSHTHTLPLCCACTRARRGLALHCDTTLSQHAHSSPPPTRIAPPRTAKRGWRVSPMPTSLAPSNCCTGVCVAVCVCGCVAVCVCVAVVAYSIGCVRKLTRHDVPLPLRALRGCGCGWV